MTKLHRALISEVTAYDKRQSKGRFWNPNALPIYMSAVDRAIEEHEKGTSIETALEHNFNDRLRDRLIKVAKSYEDKRVQENATMPRQRVREGYFHPDEMQRNADGTYGRLESEFADFDSKKPDIDFGNFDYDYFQNYNSGNEFRAFYRAGSKEYFAVFTNLRFGGYNIASINSSGGGKTEEDVLQSLFVAALDLPNLRFVAGEPIKGELYYNPTKNWALSATDPRIVNNTPDVIQKAGFIKIFIDTGKGKARISKIIKDAVAAAGDEKIVGEKHTLKESKDINMEAQKREFQRIYRESRQGVSHLQEQTKGSNPYEDILRAVYKKLTKLTDIRNPKLRSTHSPHPRDWYIMFQPFSLDAHDFQVFFNGYDRVELVDCDGRQEEYVSCKFDSQDNPDVGSIVEEFIQKLKDELDIRK